MAEWTQECGLYWRPLGGNNIDQISGHSYQYTDICRRNGHLKTTTIIVDIGKFDNHQALHVKNSAAAVPDLRELLGDGDLTAEAVFLTHSHPDHLNGLVHYLKAGYHLPPLYGGKYTRMILEELYQEFGIAADRRPVFKEIRDGDEIQVGSLTVEAVAASHTCFDSLGFFIRSSHACVFHSGDVKLDQSTFFRRPTNVKRLADYAARTDAVVADFYMISEAGTTPKEVETYRKLAALIGACRAGKIFVPVYPTHPEMYICAFLAALKNRRNVVFFGNRDFYTYLGLIVDYGISFADLAGSRIKVVYFPNDELADLDDNYVVIGTFNSLEDYFGQDYDNQFGIVTAKTYFNPLKGQMNARNIKFTTVDEVPQLQGFGHGFLGDWEIFNRLLKQPLFIPTHCPEYVIDNFRDLAKDMGIRLIDETPKNNQVFRISKKQAVKVAEAPAKWAVVNYEGELARLTIVPQKATSGDGFLKRTISRRRSRQKFKMYLYKRRQSKRQNHGSFQV